MFSSTIFHKFGNVLHLYFSDTPLSFRPTLKGPKGILAPGVDVDYECKTPESNPPAIITWELQDLDKLRRPLPHNARQAVQVKNCIVLKIIEIVKKLINLDSVSKNNSL